MISAKESPCSLPGKCAPRDELMKTFSQCAEKQYIYIQAPAGYGKTVSSTLWLQKTHLAHAWLTFDTYDNISSVFYRSLCRSLLSVCPQGDHLSQFVNNISFSTSPAESTMEFLSMISWPEGKYALVLDDFHNITNEAIQKSLPYAFRRLPFSMSVLILSRTALPDTMNIMEEDGKTAFIGLTDLAFTPEEIRHQYAKHGQFITRQEAGDIHAYTDGWAIILNAIVMSGDLETAKEKHKMSFEKFFEKNIWNSFDEATQIFLMKTSVVDSFTLKLCERLTGSQDCAEMLNKLMRLNINLSRLGDEYRYHNLFLEYLRKQLQAKDIDQRKLFYEAAAYYLETNDFYRAAVCSLPSKDKEIEMRVIHTFFKSKTPVLDQFYELAQVYDINQLTKEECDMAPIRYMPNILAAFLSGSIEKTKRLFDMFYESLPVFVELNHPIADVAVTRLILDFRVKLSAMPSFLESMKIKGDKKVPGQAAIVTLQMPLLHRSVRDFHELLDKGVMEAVRGLFSCLLPNDSECFYKSVTACLMMEQNRLDEALDAAIDAYDGITEGTAHEIYFGVSVGLAEIYRLKSESEQCGSILARLRQWIKKNKAQYLLKNLAAYEERVKLWDGNRSSAESWLSNYFVSDHAFGELQRVYQNFTTARAYIALSMTDKAAAALKQLRKLGDGLNRPLDVAEADVLAAILEWAQGKKKEACDRLHAVLTLLQPYGFIRIVANEGHAVLPVLDAVLKKLDEEAEDIGFFRFVKEVQVAAYAQSKNLNGLMHGFALTDVNLSPKQALVLELLSKGHKNAEIVELTGLSLNTIRSHTKSAYRKLEVKNAMDAIVKAKLLGILN